MDENVLEDDPREEETILRSKADEFDRLMSLLKDKVKQTEKPSEKIKLLTLVPETWTKIKIINEFSVTDYMVRTSRKLFREKGILSTPESKKGNTISKEVIDLVTEFYCNDEFSRMMPGKKDFVSLARNQHMQKRLILCNLKELYVMFKEQHPNVKIGFSKYCSLRPKWCILVGASGSHSVCVCTIHQNVSLLTDAIHIDYHDLVKMVVCNSENRECMIHRCENCPGLQPLKDFLFNMFEDKDEEMVTFKQWTKTDRSELITCTESVLNFVELLCDKIDSVTTHSFIAKSQAKYLTRLKDELNDDEVIVLGDFAENYSFVVQDEIQGFHWNTSQC